MKKRSPFLGGAKPPTSLDSGGPPPLDPARGLGSESLGLGESLREGQHDARDAHIVRVFVLFFVREALRFAELLASGSWFGWLVGGSVADWRRPLLFVPTRGNLGILKTPISMSVCLHMEQPPKWVCSL